MQAQAKIVGYLRTQGSGLLILLLGAALITLLSSAVSPPGQGLRDTDGSLRQSTNAWPRIDSTVYDFSEGNVFVVQSVHGGTVVKQLQRDLSTLLPDSESVARFAALDPALSDLACGAPTSPQRHPPGQVTDPGSGGAMQALVPVAPAQATASVERGSLSAAPLLIGDAGLASYPETTQPTGLTTSGPDVLPAPSAPRGHSPSLDNTPARAGWLDIPDRTATARRESAGEQDGAGINSGRMPAEPVLLAQACWDDQRGPISGADCALTDGPRLSGDEQTGLRDIVPLPSGRTSSSNVSEFSLASRQWSAELRGRVRLVAGAAVDAATDVTLANLGKRSLFVDQGAQMMYVYEHGLLKREIPVSTGMLTRSTFTRAWEGWVGQNMGAVTSREGMLIEQAWYLFPDVFGNIMIHTVPYIEQQGQRIYDQPHALGVRPTSHGCIRIALEDAQWLREWDPVGVPIEITGPPWSVW